MSLTAAGAAARLAASARAIEALLDGVSDDEARWTPAPDRWSALEVVCHLADEEAEDFRRRLELTLRDPGAPWPPIDPPAWAVERRYAERALEPSLARFLEERRRSLAWLRELGPADLELAHEHPRLGRIAAGDLLASWVAHDLLHVRQLMRLRYGWLEREAVPWSLEYAGPF